VAPRMLDRHASVAGSRRARAFSAGLGPTSLGGVVAIQHDRVTPDSRRHPLLSPARLSREAAGPRRAARRSAPAGASQPRPPARRAGDRSGVPHALVPIPALLAHRFERCCACCLPAASGQRQASTTRQATWSRTSSSDLGARGRAPSAHHALHAQLHAGGTRAGVRADGAKQAPVGVAGALTGALAQRPGQAVRWVRSFQWIDTIAGPRGVPCGCAWRTVRV
jgi:hypothetical protein